MAISKKTAKKTAPKKSTSKAAPRKAVKKAAPKKVVKKSTGVNKLGVKNSLVNNINAKKKKGSSGPKSASTVTKKNYKKMEDNWGKK